MPRISTRPMSASRRKALATHQITNVLGSDQSAAVIAALEVVAERLAWDTEVQRSLREKYAEIVDLSKPKPSVGTGPVPRPKGALALGEWNPLGKFDPYLLSKNYEPDQLRAVLGSATPATLREGVNAVQSHNPGTKPASRARKADMIDYIVEHVVGSGY